MRRILNIAALLMLLDGTPAVAQVSDAPPDFVAIADAEGDGFVSQDEFTAYYAVIWAIFAAGKPELGMDQANPVIRATILGVLPNASGKVSRDELLEAVPTRYSDADKDQDGVVSMAEMRAWKVARMTPEKP